MTALAQAEARLLEIAGQSPEHLQLVRSLLLEPVREKIAADPWEASRKIANPKQRAFTEALLGRENNTIIHFGGARAGKSAAACLGFLAWGYRYPGSRFLIGRYEFKRLHDSTMRSMGEALGWFYRRDWNHIEQVSEEIGRWRAGVQTLSLVGGGEYVFTHFKDAGPLGSTEFDGAWVEEAQELPSEEREFVEGEEFSRTPEVVTMLQSRLNRVTKGPTDSSYPKLVLTAMGWGHNWVWEMAYGRG